MDNKKIKKVHVVFKTHLDIGFTDLGENVLNKYRNEYIPKAIDLALSLNTDTEKKFIWTVGSFLIKDYLENSSKENISKLEKAITRGDICWHGLLCTTHTELMDEELLNYNLSISDELDSKYGKATIATKMTDVPGHTRSIIPAFSNHNKQYLHIGVNPSSMVPGVPDTFLWKYENKELIVQYSYQYGAPCYVEGMDEVLEFAHTGDNLGPQDPKVIQGELDRIQALYPNAKIVASTMDEYAKSLLKIKDTLPVVYEEIGDTWIHGIASDPLKIARYCELMRLKNKWKCIYPDLINTKKYNDFLLNLIMICEHTWGLDFKKYLFDFTNWEKEDFLKARANDITTFDMLTNRNAHMVGVLTSDINKYKNGDFTGSYKFYERSHLEQMQYISKAIDSLPDELKVEAIKVLSACEDSSSFQPFEKELRPYEHLSIGAYEIAFGGNGELVYLTRNNVKLIDGGHFGKIFYSIYSAKECAYSFYSYNREFRMNQCWSEGDFSKPGLEFVEKLDQKDYLFALQSMTVSNNKVNISLAANHEAQSRFGCPKKINILYTFDSTISCRLYIADKDANRIPEALWFDCKLDIENPYIWKMEKLGHTVHPLDIVSGGNRHHHLIQSMNYAGADIKVKIKNIHTPMINIGKKWLYGDYRELPDLREGFSYCFFNNKWDTNFKLWCEDDFFSEFQIEFN